MQSNKVIVYLGIILLGFMAIWSIKTYWPQKDSDLTMYTQKWQTVPIDKITELTVNHGKDQLVVTKTGSSWLMGKIPADNSLASDLIQNLTKPTKVTLVAMTAARHEELGIASDSATLTVKAGSATQKVVLGLMGDGGRYIKFTDSDYVYLVPNIASGTDSTQVNDWIDKTLTKIATDKITTLTTAQNQTQINLTQKDGKWFEAGNPQELDPSSFSALTSTLSSFVTQGLVDETKLKDYPAVATLTVTIEQSGSAPVTLKFYPGKDTSLVESNERQGKYVIATSVVNDFTLSQAALKFKTATSPTPTVSPTITK